MKPEWGVKIFLKQFVFFRSLNSNQIDDLIPYISVKTVKHGQFVQLCLNDQKRFFGVCNGCLKVMEVKETGQEFFKFLAFESDFFGGVMNSKNDYAFVISQEATLLSINYVDIINWLNRNPSLLRSYHDHLEHTVQSIYNWYFNMLKMSVKERILFLLNKLASKEAQDENVQLRFDRKFTQEELAVLLFTSRQSINRALTELNEERKIFYSKKRIEFNKESQTIDSM